jgi:hypothetical protein
VEQRQHQERESYSRKIKAISLHAIPAHPEMRAVWFNLILIQRTNSREKCFLGKVVPKLRKEDWKVNTIRGSEHFLATYSEVEPNQKIGIFWIFESKNISCQYLEFSVGYFSLNQRNGWRD